MYTIRRKSEIDGESRTMRRMAIGERNTNTAEKEKILISMEVKEIVDGVERSRNVCTVPDNWAEARPARAAVS
jgi:hypothetical protein